MPHFVYILQSKKDNKYYIGETTDVAAGLLFHNAGRQRSTKKFLPSPENEPGYYYNQYLQETGIRENGGTECY